VDNGDLSCTDPYQSAKGHLYRGQASVLLQLSGKTGRVVLWADSPEMLSGQAIIDIK